MLAALMIVAGAIGGAIFLCGFLQRKSLNYNTVCRKDDKECDYQYNEDIDGQASVYRCSKCNNEKKITYSISIMIN